MSSNETKTYVKWTSSKLSERQKMIDIFCKMQQKLKIILTIVMKKLISWKRNL